VGKPEGRDHKENPKVCGRIILKWSLERYDGGGMDWINLAQDRDQWRALVNTIMNLQAPYNVGKFLSSCSTGGCSRRI
jgi:hypothetical protein